MAMSAGTRETLVLHYMCEADSSTACRPQQEEAVSYYTKLESKLKEEYRKEREKVNSKPLGMAFVTFQNESMTAM